MSKSNKLNFLLETIQTSITINLLSLPVHGTLMVVVVEILNLGTYIGEAVVWWL